MTKQIKPRCPYFGACGGCQMQDIHYEQQLEIKKEAVVNALLREGLSDVPVEPTLGMKNPWFYRNKVQLPIRQQNGRLQVGYFKRHSHEVVNIKECYIQDPCLTEIAQIAREVFEDRKLTAYNEESGEGLLRHFVGRSGFQTGEMLLGIVINGNKLPSAFTVADEIKKRERLMNRLIGRHEDYPENIKKERIAGMVLNNNLTRSNVILGKANTTLMGTPFFKEKLWKFTFNIRLHSFFQVNPAQAVRLYDLVVKYADLSGEETVIDAYAGIGAISFWLAGQAANVIGIEEVTEAVRDASDNIRLNQLSNVRMVNGQVEKVFPKQAEVVILDPPRAGCSALALQKVVKARPGRIVYVSCNPQTLARDLKVLSDAGYRIEIVRPVDMFPQTDHVEVVVKLSRGRGSLAQ
jgi:23S rRNA (uracil1939-C5)-methyltransferase